jgi:tRNA G18 (ribose-2'-O)-methylase SpoU
MPVDFLDDPRLAPYRALKDKELARDGRRFIAEGELVVRRLLASGLRVESVLAARRKAAAIRPVIPPQTPLWIAPDAVIEKVIGFEFHSGVLACGVRPPPLTLDQALGPPLCPAPGAARRTLLICPKITNVENLGSLVRLAAAFGIEAMILGGQCCDPFFRQAVRVSMGAVFNLPIVRLADLAKGLRRLRQEWAFELAATVLSPDAQPLAAAGRRPNLALLLGGEADGLDAQTIALCDRRVTIPMRRGVDSLNVAVAAGIFLHHFVDQCAGG